MTPVTTSASAPSLPAPTESDRTSVTLLLENLALVERLTALEAQLAAAEDHMANLWKLAVSRHNGHAVSGPQIDRSRSAGYHAYSARDAARTALAALRSA